MKLCLPPARVRLPSLLACACVFAWLAPSARAAPTWLPSQLLTTEGQKAYESATAMGPNGDIASVWRESGGLTLTVHRASGSFSPPTTIVSSTNALTSPGIAINASGEVAIAWQNITDGKYEALTCAPGGLCSAPVAIASPTTLSSFATPVAIDAAGDVLVGVVTLAGSNELAAYAWRPAGGTFSLVPLSEPLHANAPTPAAAMDPAGDAIVAWSESTNGHAYVVRAVRRAAGGGFGAPQQVSAEETQSAFEPAAAVAAGGQVAVAWSQSDGSDNRIRVSSSASASAPPGAPQTISRAGANGSYPAVALSASGQAVAIWSEENTGEIAGGPVAGGLGPVTDLDPASGAMQLAIDEAGNAVASWSQNEGGKTRIRAVVRSAAGVVATPVTLTTAEEGAAVIVNVPSAFVGMDSSGDAVVGWDNAEDSSVHADIYDASGPALKLEAPATATAGVPVTFKSIASDLFSGVASTSWSFGDGTSSEGTGPTHTFAKPGTYTVTVTATDGVGNVTATSSPIVVSVPTPPLSACATAAGQAGSSCTARARPAACVVPKLLGLSRGAAAHRLLAAHCKLGKVTIAKRYKHAKHLVVAVQGVRAGSRLAAGASIAVTLKPPPPHRSKRRHRR
jgi:PKD repeat protein